MVKISGFQTIVLGALSIRDILICIIHSLLPSPHYYLKAFNIVKDSSMGEIPNA
ncbi:MAG: hypothetical protein PF482_10885 [Desulfobacteraceae bacterium]|nr:hypothetical protein [Desulfobacteraceae bacterium]